MSENAAVRTNVVSDIFQLGVSTYKKNALGCLPPYLAALHQDGHFHIHDLEFYGTLYNCSIPLLENYIDTTQFLSFSPAFRIVAVFDKIKELIVKLAMCQSGGIGFANFDTDISLFLQHLKIAFSESNIAYLSETIKLFIQWVNTTSTRYCREPYYLSFNLGLDTSDWGRIITKCMLNAFEQLPTYWTRPNIIFKVKSGINREPYSPNYDIFQQALACTARRMIPTYLLLDSSVNRNTAPFRLAVMGCRTRVYQNVSNEETSLGRGNLAYVSLNLPRLALENQTIERFYNALENLLRNASDVLKHRTELLQNSSGFQFVLQNRLWNVGSTDEFIKRGTLSIGFIGLAETVEILTGVKMQQDISAFALAVSIVSRMRHFVDELRKTEQRNYSLIATSGEMISGRFCRIDKAIIPHPVHEKGFYTNSFHYEVDSRVSLFEKLHGEGQFHCLCNGGCISYIEFQSAPLDNILALEDAINFGTEQGISYLGFNYPLDICRNCGTSGTFEICPACNSSEIQRIRRVSGYLEDFDYFTEGKRNEIAKRQANI